MRRQHGSVILILEQINGAVPGSHLEVPGFQKLPADVEARAEREQRLQRIEQPRGERVGSGDLFEYSHGTEPSCRTWNWNEACYERGFMTEACYRKSTMTPASTKRCKAAAASKGQAAASAAVSPSFRAAARSTAAANVSPA